jgi:hypothetical protein
VTTGFRLSLPGQKPWSAWQKDVAVTGAFAKQIGVPTPMFDATVPVYDKSMKAGHAEHDTADPARQLWSVPLGDALELLAQNPGEAEERKQHHQAEARRGIAHDLLRDLAEGIASRDDRAGP